MTWIDTHIHIWTQDTKRYPGNDLEDFEPKEFMPEDILRHAKPSGVSRIVMVQIGNYGPDNTILTDTIERFPGVFGGIGQVDHDGETIESDMKGLLEQGITGFRIGAGADVETWLQHPGYEKMFEVAAQTGQAICPITHPPGVPEIDRMCSKYPDTTVVIDHMTRLAEMQPANDHNIDQLCALSRFPNVYVKISRLHSQGKKTPPYEDLIPVVNRIIDAFGPDRLMWGSDSPYQVVLATYEDSISLVRDKLGLSDTDKQKILNDTPAKLFFK